MLLMQQVHRALYKNRIPVAVKMLTDPELRCADNDTMMSFHKELGIMARLQHPHIVRCYGGNLDCLAPFIVTELCECSLDKVRALLLLLLLLLLMMLSVSSGNLTCAHRGRQIGGNRPTGMLVAGPSGV
jgi:hypothetical protein